MILKLFHQDIRTTLLHYIGRTISHKLARVYGDNYDIILVYHINRNNFHGDEFYIGKYNIHYNPCMGLCINLDNNLNIFFHDSAYGINTKRLNIYQNIYDSKKGRYEFNIVDNYSLRIYRDHTELYKQYNYRFIYNITPIARYENSYIFKIIEEYTNNINQQINRIFSPEWRANIKEIYKVRI